MVLVICAISLLLVLTASEHSKHPLVLLAMVCSQFALYSFYVLHTYKVILLKYSHR